MRKQETDVMVSADDAIEETKTAEDNLAMDCLAVPITVCNEWQQPAATKNLFI